MGWRSRIKDEERGSVSKYDDYTREDLIRLINERDRKPKLGLLWERDEIDHDRSVNSDFVALDIDPELSCGDGPHQNLIIEGDNFDALRYLRMTHSGRVKCIYIDPPYNTGNRDFVYNDRFVDKDDAYRHSKWLEFMYRRLELAKDLLTEDGVIFVSIDDNEVFHLGLLMEKVFDAKNFIATCVWQKRYSRENRGAIGDAHEYILVYSLDPAAFKEKRGKIPFDPSQAKVYKNPDNPNETDPKKRWRGIPLTAQGYRPNQMYEVTSPSGKKHKPPEGRCWSLLEDGFNKLKEEGRIYWGKDGKAAPSMIRYLSEVDGLVPWTWWPHEEVGHTDEARKEIQDIFGTQTAFDTPKPVRLIDRILRIATKPGDTILDFFAGSGTTAHAVINLNAEGNGDRHYILVSSTETTPEAPEKNLCRDVCAERVRRIIQGYTGKKGEAAEAIGGSFAYLRSRRIPIETVFNRIQHDQIWTAIQLINEGPVAVYQKGAAIQTMQTEKSVVIYAPTVSEAVIADIENAIQDIGQATIYSWQPALLAQRIETPKAGFEPIPQFLVNRFGSGAKR